MRFDGELKVARRFVEFPDFAREHLVEALKLVEARLEAAILADEPDRTGALRSLTRGAVFDDKDRIAAKVAVVTDDPNLIRKAAALEYGSRGIAVSLQAHKARLGHFWSRHVTERMVEVEAHSRVPTIAAQRFLRDPVAAVREEALVEMQAAVTAAAEESA